MDFSTHLQIKYKCEDFDCAGQNEVTNAVHLGKHHSEKYECGLCNFKVGSLENLETTGHFFSHVKCNKYVCREGLFLS